MSVFAFIPDRNLVDRQDAKNQVTHYDYSSMNRLTNVVHQGAWKAAFSYDANGNTTAVSNQQSAVSFSYDPMNRLSSSFMSVHSRSFAVTNSYDLNGNRTNIVYPGGLSVGYSYDAENRLIAVIANRANFTNSFAFGYDGASRLTNLVYPNGVQAALVYDAENRVTALSHGSFINRAITRDARGYKTRENIITGLEPVMTNGQQKLTHNAADQLTHVDQRDTWFGGELNQWYNRDYSYDNNGCLTQEAVTRPFWNTNTAIHEYTVNYTYDYDNRLVESSYEGTVIRYQYDASGARIARITNNGSLITTNWFVLDYKAPLKMPLAEADAQGRITRYYVWGTQGLLCHLDMNPTNGALLATRYYHADDLGSTLALTDQNGTLTDQFAYSPHGEVWGRTGSTDTPYGWLGGLAVRSEGNGLYFMLNRYYSAALRRFLSIDPSGIDSFPNLYAYANLNPLAFVDPYGLEAKSFGSQALNFGQSALDVAGIIFPIADAANVGISAARGDWVAAAASAAAIFTPIPSSASKTALRAADAAIPSTLYHYTQSENVAGILENGLQPGKISKQVFTTPVGTYSPMEAQMYLGLPPNRGLSSAVFEIDAGALRSIGVTPSAGPMRVLPTPNAMGGGTEVMFNERIPSSVIRQVR